MELLAKLIAWFKSVVDLFKAFAAGFEETYGFEVNTL